MAASPSSLRLPSAIGALSRSLPPAARLSPELFRLAKFDRPEATVTFWKLLYTLLKQIQGGGRMESPDIGTQVRFVKYVVFSHGYRRLKFYQLPSDGSLGSKELLLVFSWLLCRVSLVKQSLTLNRLKLWDEIVVCMCDTPVKSQQFERNLGPAADGKGHRDIRYLQWLNGQLEFQWRNCHTEQQEQCKLLHEVHLYTFGSHVNAITGHFSITEVDVVRQPDSYKQLLHFIESDNSRLEAFLKWKPMEPVYWHWMVRTREQEQQGEKEFSRTIKRIEAAVDLKLSDLKCHNHACRIKKIHGPYRLVFKGKSLKGHKMDSIKSAATNKAITRGITAEDVITDLRKQEARLKAELKQQQEESRNKLHEAVKKLSHMLFIPPMRRQKQEIKIL